MQPIENQISPEIPVATAAKSNLALYIAIGASVVAMAVVGVVGAMFITSKPTQQGSVTSSQASVSVASSSEQQDLYEEYVNEEYGVGFLLEKGMKHVIHNTSGVDDMILAESFYPINFAEGQEIGFNIFENKYNLTLEQWVRQHTLKDQDLYGRKADEILAQFDSVLDSDYISLKNYRAVLLKHQYAGFSDMYSVAIDYNKHVILFTLVGISQPRPRSEFLIILNSLSLGELYKDIRLSQSPNTDIDNFIK